MREIIMKLTRIVLVNWYLFNPIDIELKGNTALIGENGVGKSTVIDAIQAVLFGGNNNYIKFNAQSSDSGNDRSLKSYCLGVFRPDASSMNSAKNRLRSECVSYLGLVFEDDNGKVVNLLIGIESWHDEPKALVRMMGVSEGNKPLSYRNFVDINSVGECNTNPIATARELLKLEGFNFSYFSKMSEYCSAAFKFIGPKEIHDWIDPHALSQTLSRSLSLNEIPSVSSFVENFILEENKINIDTLINSRNRYYELQGEVAKDKAKLEALQPIKTKLSTSLAGIKKGLSYKWLYYENKIAALDLKQETKREERYELCSGARQLTKDRLTNNRKIISDSAKLQNLQFKIATNNLAQQEISIKERIEELIKDDAFLEGTLATLSTKLDAICRLKLDDNMTLDVTAIYRLRILVEHQDSLDFKGIDECLDLLIESLAEDLKLYSLNQYSAMDTQFNNSTTELEELHGWIENAKKGTPPLTNKTNLVIQALRDKNIKVKPLCELAVIIDKAWQPAIEAVLGVSGCEALIVEPKDIARAISIYRELRKEKGRYIYGVNIVKTSKFHDWLNNINKGSAAELVQSDNEYALAYLHHRLGGFLLANTEDQLKEHRAITQDGMVSTNAIVSKNELPTTFLRLVKDQSENIASWEKKFEGKSKERDQSKDAKNKHETNHGILTDFVSWYGETPPSTVAINKRREEIKIEKSTKEEQLEQLDLTFLDNMKREEEDLGSEIKKLGEANTNLIKSHSKKVESLKTLRIDEKIITKKELPLNIERRKEIELNPFYTQQRTDEIQENNVEEISDYQNYLDKASGIEKRAESAFYEGRDKLLNYLNDDDFILDRTIIDAQQLTPLLDLITKKVDYIEEHGLARHDFDAKEACKAVSEAFRTDVLNRLSESFVFMKGQFDVLNKALKNKEFHYETYQFTRKPKKEYKELIDYIMKSNDFDVSSANDLFDDTPDNVVEQIDKLVDTMSEGSTVIDDYRQYFTYDVRVISKGKTGEKGKEVMLSKLLKTGSGGEKQSPFYVAIASSLASAWQTLKHPGESAGLTLLDEAFNKLSERNLSSAINFMNEVGLQLIVAVPSERETVFRPVMDTVIYFIKEGEAVAVESDMLTSKGRVLLTKSNPSYRENK